MADEPRKVEMVSDTKGPPLMLYLAVNAVPMGIGLFWIKTTTLSVQEILQPETGEAIDEIDRSWP
jgi:hypothetical protein